MGWQAGPEICRSASGCAQENTEGAEPGPYRPQHGWVVKVDVMWTGLDLFFETLVFVPAHRCPGGTDGSTIPPSRHSLERDTSFGSQRVDPSGHTVVSGHLRVPQPRLVPRYEWQLQRRREPGSLGAGQINQH